jgi:hypothetical protein
MRMNLEKYCTIKVEKNKLKRVPGRAPNYFKKVCLLSYICQLISLKGQRKILNNNYINMMTHYILTLAKDFLDKNWINL